jgi:hypothetical protein
VSPTPPPVARGGNDNPLAKFKRGGLKKAAGSSVVAEMISTQQPEQPAAEPAPQPPVQDHEPPPAAAPATETAPVAAPAPATIPAPDAVRTAQEVPQVHQEPAPPQPQDIAAPAHVQALHAPAQAAPAALYGAAAAASAELPSAPPVQAPVAEYLPPFPVQQYVPPVQQQTVQGAIPQYGQPAPAPAPAAVPQQPAAPKSKKTSFHQPVDSGDRMRSTYNATRHLTRYLTMSEFICAAVDKMCAELEEKYNDGERFDADPGAVPKGRPVGS